MSRQRRYRTVVLEGPLNTTLGKVVLNDNERVVREMLWPVQSDLKEPPVRVVVLIKEKVDVAKENAFKKEQKALAKERKLVVHGEGGGAKSPQDTING